MTDAVAIWGLIIGGIGSAAGLGALVYAHVANSNAKKSGKTADDSKTLAEQANDLARESNTIATDARKLAEEANDMSRRGEARETERHDVQWDGDWRVPGVYVLTKLGDDEARDVKATVAYDGERVTQYADVISINGGELTFELPTAVEDFHREAREHLQQLRAARNATFNLGVAWGMHFHNVEERVDWTTPRGRPEHYENDVRLSTFDHWYPRD